MERMFIEGEDKGIRGIEYVEGTDANDNMVCMTKDDFDYYCDEMSYYAVEDYKYDLKRHPLKTLFKLYFNKE